jgi:hypothetical protein
VKDVPVKDVNVKGVNQATIVDLGPAVQTHSDGRGEDDSVRGSAIKRESSTNAKGVPAGSVKGVISVPAKLISGSA